MYITETESTTFSKLTVLHFIATKKKNKKPDKFKSYKIIINKTPKVPFLSENEKYCHETKQGKKQADTTKKIRNRKEKKWPIKRKQTEKTKYEQKSKKRRKQMKNQN